MNYYLFNNLQLRSNSNQQFENSSVNISQGLKEFPLSTNLFQRCSRSSQNSKYLHFKQNISENQLSFSPFHKQEDSIFNPNNDQLFQNPSISEEQVNQLKTHNISLEEQDQQDQAHENFNKVNNESLNFINKNEDEYFEDSKFLEKDEIENIPFYQHYLPHSIFSKKAFLSEMTECDNFSQQPFTHSDYKPSFDMFTDDIISNNFTFQKNDIENKTKEEQQRQPYQPFTFEEDEINKHLQSTSSSKVSYYHLYEQHKENMKLIETQQLQQQPPFHLNLNILIEQSQLNSSPEKISKSCIGETNQSNIIGSPYSNLMSSTHTSQTQLNDSSFQQSLPSEEIKTQPCIHLKKQSRRKKKGTTMGNKMLAKCGDKIVIEVEGVVESKENRKRSKQTLFYTGRDGQPKRFARITKSMIRPVCNALSRHLKLNGANIDRIDWLNQLRTFLVENKQFIKVAIDFFENHFERYVQNSPKLIEKHEYLLFKGNWIKGVQDPINFKGLKWYS